jgi:hypothetical protein
MYLNIEIETKGGEAGQGSTRRYVGRAEALRYVARG